jgi:hypothetical protein
MKFDPKQWNRDDRLIIGGAAVAFVAAFLPWWGYSGPVNLYSASVSGWSAGFSAWAGALLLTAAGVLWLLHRSEVALPTTVVGPAVAVTGAAALGLFLVIMRWLTLPRVHGGVAGSIGAKYGIWIAIIGGAVELVAAVDALRTSGEPLPWKHEAVPEAPADTQS